MDSLTPEEQLNVGDVGIIIGSHYHPENIGRECVVVAPLGWYTAKQTNTDLFSYKVEFDGKRFLVRPEWIRKKRPPAKDRDVVRWADCPWQPEGVRA